MIYKKIFLDTINDNASKGSYIEMYLHEDDFAEKYKRSAMLIVPGGGYFSIAQLEMKTVALRYCAEGFNCFTISYGINQPYPVPHLDLAIAATYIKLNKNELGIDGRLFMAGFSAGGHLVGSYSYLYKELANTLEINDEFLKPDAIILAYPVVSFIHNPHIRSRDIITGSNEALFEKFSIEKNITPDYPPTFIWVTLGDRGVNPSNTFDMIQELENNGVLHEKLYFETLDHGSSVMTHEVKSNYLPFTEIELACKVWVDKSINFILNNFYKGGNE